MPAAPKHRQAIVDAAVTLFRRKGYAATGLNDIVDLSGAPKGSLYHYFPEGKASIAEAAVREAGRRAADTVSALAGESRSGADLIRRHAALLAEWMARSGYRDGAPITTVVLELAPADEAVTAAAAEATGAWRAIVADKLIEDGYDAARAARLAVLCTSALEGALIQARVARGAAPLETAAAEIAALLAADPPA